MKHRSTQALLGAVAVFGVLVGISGPAAARNLLVDQVRLQPGQHARLNVGLEPGRITCRVTLAFYDAKGRLISQRGPITLKGGEGRSLKVRDDGRVRAMVRVSGGPCSRLIKAAAEVL